jgi:hypothetical protein
MRVLAGIVAFCSVAAATTLQQLTIDQMIQQSTAIVRVKVTGSAPVARGSVIYTQYQFTLLETLKSGQNGTFSAVSVPGGAMGTIRQMVAGAPSLASGQEYVIFLWTSKSGLTQVIGLSQGLFTVLQDSAGTSVLVRPAATVSMVNQNGAPVSDSLATMTLQALRTEIQSVVGAGN